MRDWSYASPSQLEGMVDREIYSSRHVAIVISCNTNGYCGAAYDVGTQGSPSLKRLLRLNPQVWLNRVHTFQMDICQIKMGICVHSKWTCQMGIYIHSEWTYVGLE